MSNMRAGAKTLIAPLRGARIRGITLTSTVIGVALVALLLMTNVATLTYSARSAREISYRLAARNVVQGVLERMFAFPYDEVTQGTYDQWINDQPDVRVLDSINNVLCDITIEIVDELDVTSATSTSITAGNASWEADRWAGGTVFVVGGPGQGQRATIVSNTADTLTTHLIGFGQSQWISNPTSASTILINGGKVVRVTASFDFRGRTYTETVEGLVVRDG